MAILLALITSAVYGTSDFLGGLATRQTPVARVMLWAHGAGLLAVAAVAPFVAERVVPRDIGIGLVAGAVGLVGLMLLYHALSVGPMAVVAPVSGLFSAVVPLAVGLARDPDGLTAVVGVGLALGLVAVITTSWPTDADRAAGHSVRLPVVAASVGAGSCFGSLVLLYDATDADGAPWPIVWGRLLTVTLLAGWSLSRGAGLLPRRAERGAVMPAIAAGLGDTAANVTLLYATLVADGGVELAVVSVVIALYPAATVVLARFALGERLSAVRIAGLGVTAVAIALLALA